MLLSHAKESGCKHTAVSIEACGRECAGEGVTKRGDLKQGLSILSGLGTILKLAPVCCLWAGYIISMDPLIVNPIFPSRESIVYPLQILLVIFNSWGDKINSFYMRARTFEVLLFEINEFLLEMRVVQDVWTVQVYCRYIGNGKLSL